MANTLDGIHFFSPNYKRELLYVTDKAAGVFGWICYKHPDGGWVTLREATEADLETIAGFCKSRREYEYNETTDFLAAAAWHERYELVKEHLSEMTD